MAICKNSSWGANFARAQTHDRGAANQGVDVGASAFLRQRLLDLAAEGVAILLISEVEEIFQIADRIAVIAHGRVSPTCPVRIPRPDKSGLWMSGLFEKTIQHKTPLRPNPSTI